MNNWPLPITYDKRSASVVENDESNLNQKKRFQSAPKNEIETSRNFKQKSCRTTNF